MFISFSDAACRHLAQTLPPGFSVQRLTTTSNLEAVVADGVNGIDFAHSVYSYASNTGMVDRAHSLGLSVGCWTVDATNAIEKVVALGVDAVTSNRPDVVRDLVGPRERFVPNPATLFVFRSLQK